MIGNKLQHCYENYSFLKRIYDIESRPVVGSYGPGEDSEIFNQASEAYGVASHAEGGGTKTSEYAMYAHAEGHESEANGMASHAEGTSTIASGEASHAEGEGTEALDDCSHAEGYYARAYGYFSHAEGSGTEASGVCSHAEGESTNASGDMSHAEGSGTIASGDCSHAEGYVTMANGYSSHAEGWGTKASSDCQHVEGQYNVEDANGIYVHIIGWGTDDSNRKNIHTVDTSGNAMFTGKVTVGDGETIPEPTADGDLITKKYFDDNSSSAGVGKDTEGMSWNKYDESYTGVAGAEIFNNYEYNIASGDYSHAEGSDTTASGPSSHAEGCSTIASAHYSHAEGSNTIASGDSSHAEGDLAQASGFSSHAEGCRTIASEYYSHAEGSGSVASGEASHAEGDSTTASGIASHVEGYYTEASSDYQHVQGKYNVEDTDGIYAHIIGWGSGDTSRKNIFTVSTSGAGVFASSCTATSHPTSSSRRFKENFRDVDISESEKILSLKTQKFDFKEEYGGMKDRVGFIAEDVEPIFPNCVSYDPKGVITGIDYSSFVPYIIEIIKQQAAEIEELKSMIVS